MLLTRLLNACHHFPGFVYTGAQLRTATNTIEVDVRPRQGSKARCSGCHRPASGYDQMPQRGFEFIPVPFVQLRAIVRRGDGPPLVTGSRDTQIELEVHLFF